MKRIIAIVMIAITLTAPVHGNVKDVGKKFVESNKDKAKHPEDCTKYGSGQLKVGADIPAGEYVLYPENPEYSGFFFESTDANGDDNVNAGSFDYSAILTITKGNYIELRNAYAVPASENPIIDRTKPGFFKVGKHIKEGEHKLSILDNTRSAFYFLYEDSTLQNIVSCDSFDNQAYVETQSGQILELRNAVLEW